MRLEGRTIVREDRGVPQHFVRVLQSEDEGVNHSWIFGKEGRFQLVGVAVLFETFKLVLELDNVFFIGLNNLEDGDKLPVFGNSFSADGSMAVRTSDLCFCVSFEKLLHARVAAVMLVHAHHDGSILS